MHRTTTLFLTLLALFLLPSLALVTGCDCGDDDDSDDGDASGLPPYDDDDTGDDDTADDDTVDDDAGDDDTADDDDTEPALESVEIVPEKRAVPVGATKAFTAVAHYDDDTTSTTEDFTWTSGDGGLLSVTTDGEATGEAAGITTLTVGLGDETAAADVLVGPDVFWFDGIAGTMGAIDRISGDVVDDYLATSKEAAANIANDIALYDGNAYITDSGDGTVGFTPDVFEGLVEIDLFTKTVTEIAADEADLDNPWAVKIIDGLAFVTGNLSDTLVVFDLDDETYEVFTLPDGCAPADVEVVGEQAYVACTFFDLGTFTYGDGKVAVVDLATKAVTTIATSQVNPGNLALSLDGAWLYVVCTGNWFDQFGKIDVIDISESSVAQTLDMTAAAPGPIAIASNGRAFIGDNFSGSVFVIDTSTNTWLRDESDPIVIAGSFWTQALAVNPMADEFYVADWTNTVTAVLGTGDYALVTNLTTSNPGGYAFWE